MQSVSSKVQFLIFVNGNSATVFSAHFKTEIKLKNELFIQDNGADDELITLMPVPQMLDQADYTTLYVRLEDAVDPENTLFVKLKKAFCSLL